LIFDFFTKIFILQQCLNPNLFGFGFGSSQNIRIISDSDSDPQHWCWQVRKSSQAALYLAILFNLTLFDPWCWQVRKTSQAALLVLLEQGLVEKSDVEQQVVFHHQR
jgi:hypothetical protein